MRIERDKEVLIVMNFIFSCCSMSDNIKYYWCCNTEGFKVTATTVRNTLVAFDEEHFHSDDQKK